MSDLIRMGEEYRLRFLPKCWEQEQHWLRRRSWQRAVLAWLLVWLLPLALAVIGGLWKEML